MRAVPGRDLALHSAAIRRSMSVAKHRLRTCTTAGVSGCIEVGAAAFRAVQPPRSPAGCRRVGLLVLGNPDPSVFLREVTTGLRELGYEDGT